MSKFWKILGGTLMLLGWLVSMVGAGQAKTPAVDKKEPAKQQVDPSSPIYLQHAASGSTLTLDGNEASKNKIAPLHWNHWSHGNHYSGYHGSHGSHWNGW